MKGRPEIGRGLFYTRDSAGHSDLAPPQYVDWARGKANALGVTFHGVAASATAMIEHGLSVQGDLYLDYGIAGNQLSRPGLDAFRKRALADLDVTHLFAPRRDRIARRDNPLEGLAIEYALRADGLTIVFMDQVLAPLPRGERIGLGDLLTGVIDYDTSGKFRRELAEKLIHAKIKLAERGFSIGGEPVYGFRRWLVAPDGTRKRELEAGEVVKMSGHHVVWLPTAEAEMEVIRRILESIETTPASRIARTLNEEGVPSPKAGRMRRLGGIAVPNAGLWTQNTVKNIATHPLLIACWEYGRRAMGVQLRFTPSGPRSLTDGDYRPDGRPRSVINPTERVIRTPTTFEPIIPQKRRDRIVQVLQGRGAHLKGKARTRGDSPNPLGGRIYDMNCGWLMYRHARRGRWGYQCGLYQNSQGKSCPHNVVGGEATTGFVLSCIRQRMMTPTAIAKLEARLREMAESESGDKAAQQRVESDRSRLAALEKKLATVGRNMALAETADERAATAIVFRELQAEAGRLRSQIQSYPTPEAGHSPEHDVKAALAGLDRLTELAKSQSSLGEIGELFRRLDVRLYLRFHTTQRGRQQTSAIGGGVVTFGSTPPPGPLYEGPTDRAIIRQKLASGEPVSSVARPFVAERSSSDPEAQWSANVQRGTLRCSGPRPLSSVIIMSAAAGSAELGR